MKEIVEISASMSGIEIVGAAPLTMAERAFVAGQLGCDLALGKPFSPPKVINFQEARARLTQSRCNQPRS